MNVTPFKRPDSRTVDPRDVLALPSVFVGRNRIVNPELGRRLVACAGFGLVSCDQVGRSTDPIYEVELTPRGRAAVLCLGMLHDAGMPVLAPGSGFATDQAMLTADFAAALAHCSWRWREDNQGDCWPEARETLRLLQRARLARYCGDHRWIGVIPEELALCEEAPQ